MALNSQQQSALVSALTSKGYRDIDAQNAAANAGGRADDLYREYVGGGMSSGGGGGDSGQYLQELRKAIELGVQSMTGQKEVVNKQSEQRKTELQQQASNLEQRYSNLIDEIKGQTEQAVNRTTGTSREELARRGIDLQGNLAQTEINSAVNPINQQSAREIKDVGLSRESDLTTIANQINNIPIEQQQQILAIDQAIASALQSGNAQALQFALQQAAQVQDQIDKQRTYELQLAVAEQNRLKNEADIKNIESQIANRVSGGSGSISPDQEAIVNSYWQAAAGKNASVPDYFKPVTTANTYTALQTEPIKHADFRMSINPDYKQDPLARPVPTPGMSR